MQIKSVAAFFSAFSGINPLQTGQSRNLDLNSKSNPCTFYVSSDTAFRPFPMIFWNLLQYPSLPMQQVIYLLG